MRVASLNVNGLRSGAGKGLFNWLAQARCDFLCLQEIKCLPEDLVKDPVFRPDGWSVFFNSSQQKGRSGVAVYARRAPDTVLSELGSSEFDSEGRYLELRYGKLSIVSLYFPSGSAGPERQASKYRFLDMIQPLLAKWRRSKRDYILCGDWNIAHRPIDLKNWRSNQKNSGFLPEERAWLDVILGEMGWLDGYRHLYPEQEGESYTWWSNRGQAYSKNVGWRIDYQVISPTLGPAVKAAAVFKDSRFSDHAPLILDYDV